MVIDEGKVRRILAHPTLSQRVRNMLEDRRFPERLGSIVTDEGSLGKIKSFLEKEHAVQCLLLLYIDRWREARKFMSDGTFKARMNEMKELGLSVKNETIPLRSSWIKTVLCSEVAQVLLELLEEQH
jgi:hypothetical protein